MFKRLKPKVSNPVQHMLDELFAKTTRVRVLNGGASRGKTLGKEVLLDVSDAGSIADLHGCLTVIEDENTFGHCACLGDQALEVYAGRRRLATIGLHHGRSIRWDAWQWDALLKDSRGLLAWMADRGVPPAAGGI